MKISCLVLLVFTRLGALAQNGSEIILFDAAVNKSGITLSAPVNITHHKGYDSQPFFSRDDIYYSSEADSAQMEIKKYNYKTKVTVFITHTGDNEFSPTITPGKKYISCILQRKNGKQDLVKYPLGGGAASVIISDLKVGYHAWITEHSLLLFVLEDTATNGLHYFDIATGKDIRLSGNIGRSIQSIPGEQAASFIQKSADQWMIKKCDASAGNMVSIMPALPGCEFMAWTHSGCVVMSDGKDLYWKNVHNNGDWKKVVITGDLALKKITRLAFNENDTKMAVVIAE